MWKRLPEEPVEVNSINAFNNHSRLFLEEEGIKDSENAGRQGWSNTESGMMGQMAVSSSQNFL